MFSDIFLEGEFVAFDITNPEKLVNFGQTMGGRFTPFKSRADALRSVPKDGEDWVVVTKSKYDKMQKAGTWLAEDVSVIPIDRHIEMEKLTKAAKKANKKVSSVDVTISNNLGMVSIVVKGAAGYGASVDNNGNKTVAKGVSKASKKMFHAFHQAFIRELASSSVKVDSLEYNVDGNVCNIFLTLSNY